MPRVLIIVYYWPPSGGGGVQRWLKFTRYLRDFGWEPVVVAPSGADYPLTDPALTREIPEGLEVIKIPIREPRRLYSRFFARGKKTEKTQADSLFYTDPQKRSLKQKLSLWVRSNVFIPDARVLWTFSLKPRLRSWLRQNPVDAIITTGTPHSLHLVGRYLHRKTGLPWIADFRDPWTEIEFYELLTLTSWADRRHRKLESSVIREADAVVTVSRTWASLFREKGAKKVVPITNGFDPQDFPESPPLAARFTLFHAGTLAFDRNPDTLWRVLADLKKERGFPGFEIRLAGQVDSAVLDSIRSHGLAENLVYLGYISHDEAIREMQQAQLLLLLVNQSGINAPGRLPGKVFEYLAAQRPILCLGPEKGELAGILQEAGAGETLPGEDEARLREALSARARTFREAGSLPAPADSSLEKFTRQALTRQLSRLLDEITAKPEQARA